MYYRPQEKRRSTFLTIVLYTVLLIMIGTLAFLLGIYTGYFNVEVPTLAERYAPTPTPTRSALLYISNGDLDFAEGRLDAAIESYDKAIAIDPTIDIPYIRQSRILVYTRDTGSALAQAEKAVLLNPTSPENLAYYCRALDWEAQYSAAYDACTCASEIDPTYAEAYAFLSEVFADQGDWFSARETAQQAIDANFQSMDAHHNMGYAWEVQGRYADAIKFYENAITLAPKLGPNYISAGRAYYWQGEYELAEERFKRAIKLMPFDPTGYYHLGRTYYTEGDFISAIDAFEQSVGVDPSFVSINPAGTSAWGYLGMTYYRRQNYENAIEFLPKAIDLVENKFLDRVREVQILTEIQTLTGPQYVPVLRGRFARNSQSDGTIISTQLQPVSYQSNLEESALALDEDGVSDEDEAIPAEDLEPEEDQLACVAAIVRSIQNQVIIPGLQSTELLTLTNSFSGTTGTASLDFSNNSMTLVLNDVPQPKTAPYEVSVGLWPDRTESMGFVQPDGSQKISTQIQFDEKLVAPIDYYYTLGLSYANMNMCNEARPWLLAALDRDSSAYNPAWYGTRLCSIADTPPTPLPTFTPEPE
ncbi:MAG: tetratricopeptide repeat protein [Anaerolineae bacterium]|nr:tetratricopeptide repeat protein [Anaerolineae bacterium]